jgi:hypothetical protein
MRASRTFRPTEGFEVTPRRVFVRELAGLTARLRAEALELML